MNKKALITISSCQIDDADNKVELITLGNFKEKDGIYETIYKESEESGLGETETVLKIEKDMLTLKRSGAVSTVMEFKKDNNSVILYETPYGILEFKTITKDLKIDVNENGGNVYINYSLIADGQAPLKTELKLDIKVKN
ncbi:MAG: DUF1934 domain-containing protein [Clostridium perfringens]|nr:DUF1934 domain-containing protein [Clostridium perfringens]